MFPVGAHISPALILQRIETHFFKLDLALKYNVPIICHSRSAGKPTLEFLIANGDDAFLCLVFISQTASLLVSKGFLSYSHKTYSHQNELRRKCDDLKNSQGHIPYLA